MLVLGDELDGPSASLRYGGVMLPRERDKTDVRIECKEGCLCQSVVPKISPLIDSMLFVRLRLIIGNLQT